ncbi:uncharacterized protein BDZ83DRAFT_656121 [Colletotrichum acutatum]|uniref:Uncharacterized protein n=1 Tax=Glomerella acutata TaxID=27357 RepID=A0AAD8UDS4_GLOAC|nr:uncharacterized protein BDZ83DRAFT_656121 [Colletotrichum acutatum]KAK1714093.1 hypothetical protein BDZ83DRAFT_656121 [Colletotrichum acutatum]
MVDTPSSLGGRHRSDSLRLTRCTVTDWRRRRSFRVPGLGSRPWVSWIPVGMYIGIVGRRIWCRLHPPDLSELLSVAAAAGVVHLADPETPARVRLPSVRDPYGTLYRMGGTGTGWVEREQETLIVPRTLWFSTGDKKHPLEYAFTGQVWVVCLDRKLIRHPTGVDGASAKVYQHILVVRWRRVR